MRVTTNMIFSQTMYNLTRNIDRYMGVQSQLSSGRRINTASDDPIGTQHDLNYRKRLEEIDQYLSNISQGSIWMSTYENGLADLKDMYTSIKEIAITMVNESNDDPVTRESAAGEVESLLEQVLQIANGEIDGRYIYSGHRTHISPLEASGNGAVYNGDRGNIDMELDVGSRMTSNLIGEDVFLKQLLVLGSESNLDVALTSDTLLSDVNLGDGIEQVPGTFEIFDNNQNITYTIDVSAATTVGDVVSMINTQLGPGSNLSVKIADSGASLQWEPVAPVTNTLDLSTPLSNLNNGNGISTDPGTFVVRNADSSISVEIDISTASTVGDVLMKINTTLMINGVSGISVGFNPDGTGLQFTDGNATPLGLVVEDVSEAQTTALDLGIVGSMDPILIGEDISPRLDFIIGDIAGQTTGNDLGLLGTVHHSTVGQNIRPRITVDNLLSDLNNGVGFDFGELKISQGSQTAIVNLGNSSLTTVDDLLSAINSCGLEILATLNDAGTGIQIVPTVEGKSLMIESNDSSKTAHSLGVVGSSDMIGSLMLMINSLRAGDRDVVDQLNGNMDLAIDELLGNRAGIGSKMIRMETTRGRLEMGQINVTRLLSEVEDADIVGLVSELGRQESLYQAALLASSKLMQQSLVDFLR